MKASKENSIILNKLQVWAPGSKATKVAPAKQLMKPVENPVDFQSRLRIYAGQ